jgi:hypothetical protein
MKAIIGVLSAENVSAEDQRDAEGLGIFAISRYGLCEVDETIKLAEGRRRKWLDSGLDKNAAVLSPVQGFVGRVSRHDIRGWAFNTAVPDERLQVIAKLRGEVVGSASADIFRANLANANIGSGEHAFIIQLLNAIELDDAKLIEVKAISLTEAEFVLVPVPGAFSPFDDILS